MKLYIDDTRPAPEGWVLADSFHAGLAAVAEAEEEITHIAFDWQLDPDRPSLNGERLLHELALIHFEEVPVFTQPREHYTCHSSDAHKREKMGRILDAVLAAKDCEDFRHRLSRRSASREAPKMSALDRLRKAKRR